MNRFNCLKHVQLYAYNSKKKIDSIVRTLTPVFVKKRGRENLITSPEGKESENSKKGLE